MTPYPSGIPSIDVVLFPYAWRNQWNASEQSHYLTYSLIPSMGHITHFEKAEMVGYLECVLGNATLPSSLEEGYCPSVEAMMHRTLDAADACTVLAQGLWSAKVDTVMSMEDSSSAQILARVLEAYFLSTLRQGMFDLTYYEHLLNWVIEHQIDSKRSLPSARMQHMIRGVLDEYSHIANIVFEPVIHQEPDITLKLGQWYPRSIHGWGVNNYNGLESRLATIVITAIPPELKEDWRQVLMHEVGHVLGLKHPFDGNPRLMFPEDNTGTTVMSYRRLARIDEAQGPVLMGLSPLLKDPYNFAIYGAVSLTPGPYDIQALHYLYGPNTHFRNHDTHYIFSEEEPTTIDQEVDRITFNIHTPQSFTIYDTGGYNQLDVSACHYSQRICLNDWQEALASAAMMTCMNIVCHSYFFIMGDIHALITSQAPISIGAPRNLERRYDIHSSKAGIVLEAGNAAQTFYVHPQPQGHITIMGFCSKDRLMLSKALVDNIEALWKHITFGSGDLLQREKLLLPIHFVEPDASPADAYDYITYGCPLDSKVDGHVQLCLGSDCAYRIDLIYVQEVFDSQSFTPENVDFF